MPHNHKHSSKNLLNLPPTLLPITVAWSHSLPSRPRVLACHNRIAVLCASSRSWFSSNRNSHTYSSYTTSRATALTCLEYECCEVGILALHIAQVFCPLQPSFQLGCTLTHRYHFHPLQCRLDASTMLRASSLERYSGDHHGVSNTGRPETCREDRPVEQSRGRQPHLHTSSIGTPQIDSSGKSL